MGILSALGAGLTAAGVTAAVAIGIAAVGTGAAAIAQAINHGKGHDRLKKENVISLNPGESIDGRNIKDRFPEYSSKYHDIKELASSKLLTHDFKERAILKNPDLSRTNAIICPDYETD